ncbi:cation diffusion facilitator CzcD-associated flavoprotein CzcO [Frigoribacterium sp. PhB160]|uniref:flavin-containing monooxygenase n=1 Tax=Frigoribacterium sp. PhB160 TaxID=2485192 RepID=UPI000F491BA0|nr:NAD(P)/FAD-dependent oxidoreductase [Frigoribacterium sp. PhB160]ROS58263.1 cation diffusion facilitator CzcD-associated flavoprotein CzcO [Frigoribacterium sp. PhB160]
MTTTAPDQSSSDSSGDPGDVADATATDLDIVIVGAGLSGIGAAARLRAAFPDRRIAILESRAVSGGTWDLFRYPGVRSDSDMATLGYPFRPWTDRRAIAPGATILQYIRDTAAETGVDRLVRYGHRVVAADWSSDDDRWRLTVETGEQNAPGTGTGTGTGEPRATGEPRTTELTTVFLFLASGYYRYDQGHRPTFPGEDDFTGRFVHPQQWPDDLDTAGRDVVVIGSGATAMTLVPALAREGARVTMLQRSPTWVTSLPSIDRRLLPRSRRIGLRASARVSRWRGIAGGLLTYQFSRRAPERTKRFLRSRVAARLPEGFDVDRHFTPRYDPWDERLCVVPDGDLFRALRDGTARVVTDTIDTITPGGVRLTSGEELPADVIVTATGLTMQLFGGMRLTLDGSPVDPADHVAYKGAMLDGVPNMAFAVGYTNASWTLKIDLVVRFVERVLHGMEARGETRVTPAAPTRPGRLGELSPLIDLRSGYVARGLHLLPRQGAHAPWRLHQNYLRDLVLFRLGRVRGDGLVFGGHRPAGGASSASTPAAAPATTSSSSTPTTPSGRTSS